MTPAAAKSPGSWKTSKAQPVVAVVEVQTVPASANVSTPFLMTVPVMQAGVGSLSEYCIPIRGRGDAAAGGGNEQADGRRDVAVALRLRPTPGDAPGAENRHEPQQSGEDERQQS